MALKQRKQITGTTEQINQYAGVEGQLVWDKSAKTLVGMSGTAGKNYPLAPKAYVDNEIKKVNAEVAKKQPQGNYATTAQVTEGLAGKEDKGVCLPLTGGELTGSLAVKGKPYAGTSASIYTTDPSKELMIATGNADFTKGGGALTLYGRDHEHKGGWALVARSRDDDVVLLQGNPITRSLMWDEQIVDTIVQEHVEGGDGFIKYASGYQIVWGTGRVGAGELQPVTLTTPFSNVHYTVVANGLNAYGFWTTQVRYTTKFTGILADPANGPFAGSIVYVAFGRWK